MYASQTKRLCVRESPSDETRAQHHSNSSTEVTTNILIQQQQPSPSAISPSASILIQDSNNTNLNSTSNFLPTLAIKRSFSARDSIGSVDTASGLEPTGLRFTASMTASATDSTTACTDGENQSPTKPPAKASNSVPVMMHNSGSALNESNDCVNKDSRHSHSYSEQDLIDRLVTATSEQIKLDLILAIRNLITACNKKKDSLVKDPNFLKTFHIVDINDESSSVVKAQYALLLCSLAKGGRSNVKILNDSFVDEKIFNLILNSQDNNLIEACLRCLRAFMSWPQVSRSSLLYERNTNKDTENNVEPKEDKNLKKIIEYIQTSKSFVVHECVADIFALTCCQSQDQLLLFNYGALSCIAQLTESKSSRVVVSALNWLTSICLKNRIVSHEACKTVCPSGTPLLNRLIDLMSKDECCDLQFLSAKCFTQIYRAAPPELMEKETRVAIYVLPTLVRMTQRDKATKLRAEAAECIAYLIEYDKGLQETASICDHLIKSLANMLEQDSSNIYDLGDQFQHSQYPHHLQLTSSISRNPNERDLALSAISTNHRQHISSHILDLRRPPQLNVESGPISDSVGDNNKSSEYSQEMRQAAFLALAALASSQETIRKKIFETCAIMQHLIRGLSENEHKTLKSVLTCLLSLSRSVQQLRTSFAENSVYTALKGLLNFPSDDILILVLAVLCNISLDFSPGKQQFLDSATIGTLCDLTNGNDQFLKLHAMWILMNMVYQLKDQNLKFQIFRSLGPDHVLNILETETHEELLLKTLGFLRNLLSQKPHIDAIMNNHGEQIMKSLTRVLERPCSAKIKEQALCVLTNIADGSDAKALLMSNRFLMSYLARIICDEEAGDTRLAAICCITNLAHQEQNGSYERRDEMRKFGIEDKLKSMLNTNDPILSDRVRTAYNQFCRGIDDKSIN